MIRRKQRSLPSLSKSLSKITLIGGSESAAELCSGFYDGEDGLGLCPAAGANPVGVLTSDDLYSIDYHPSQRFTILLYTNGSSCLLTKEDVKIMFIDGLPAGNPFCFETKSESGRDLIYVVCGNKMGVYNCGNGETDIYDLPSAVYGGVAHCGRLFAVDNVCRCRIVWSGFNLTDWKGGIDGSGYIDLEGSLGGIQRLENFDDDVLCVRDYGFTIVKALADSRNFRIAPSQYYVKVGDKINVGGVSGQKYFFSTKNGIYSFDGESVKSEYAVSGHLSEIVKVHVLGDGYVYADCIYDGGKCIMRYNPQDGKAVFFAKDCSFPFISQWGMFCEKDGRFYLLSVENDDNGRLWRSRLIGGYGRKTLKNLYVESDGTPQITVYRDGIKQSFNGTGKVPVNLSGERIYLEIGGNSPVRSVVAELEVRK